MEDIYLLEKRNGYTRRRSTRERDKWSAFKNGTPSNPSPLITAPPHGIAYCRAVTAQAQVAGVNETGQIQYGVVRRYLCIYGYHYPYSIIRSGATY